MSALNDQEIVKYLLNGELVAKGLPKNYQDLINNKDASNPDWYSFDSPVQPASLDLRIGNIYIPESSSSSNGSQKYPKSAHSLEVGQTVIVMTNEVLEIPNNIVCFALPPDNLAKNGILMVNLGHVDPGWHGAVKFVLINVGNESYLIKKGDVVATFLFMKSSSDSKADYKSRYSIYKGIDEELPDYQPVEKMIATLSSDFLNIQNRAEEAIKADNDRANRRVRNWGAVITLVATIIIYITTNFISASQTDKINEIKDELNRIKAVKENESKMEQLNLELINLNDRINEIENKKVSKKNR